MRRTSPREPCCRSASRRTACACFDPDRIRGANSGWGNSSQRMTTAAAPVPSLPHRRIKPLASWEDRLAQGLLLASCAVLAVFLVAPLAMILVKSTEDKSGAFVGLQLFREYLQNAALRDSAFNTLWVGLVVTAVTVPLAFTFAYALTRSCIPWKGGFRLIALTPILSPSMLAAISF